MSTYFSDIAFSPSSTIRHFSLARHALIEAFSMLQLKPGDKVLMPEYVCRDLLASLCQFGLQPVWYSVDRNLVPVSDPINWPDAKAALAINYFGFPQPLTPFDKYAQRTGATIIEDNAHGLLSRDQEGALLGTRTSLGLFSYRKTFLIGRGAGLLVNCQELKLQIREQLSNSLLEMPLAVRVRRSLYWMFGSRAPAYVVAQSIRKFRKWQGKSEIPLPDVNAERELPGIANPDAFMLSVLNEQDLESEKQRRRCLYKKLSIKAQEIGLQVVYPELPKHTIPYGLPVRGDDVSAIAHLAADEQLDFFKWPDLPDEVASHAPSHYCDLYLINFL